MSYVNSLTSTFSLYINTYLYRKIVINSLIFRLLEKKRLPHKQSYFTPLYKVCGSNRISNSLGSSLGTEIHIYVIYCSLKG